MTWQVTRPSDYCAQILLQGTLNESVANTEEIQCEKLEGEWSVYLIKHVSTNIKVILEFQDVVYNICRVYIY